MSTGSFWSFVATVAYAGVTASLCDLVCQGLEMRVSHESFSASDSEGSRSDPEEAGQKACATCCFPCDPAFYDWRRNGRYVVCPGLCAGVASYVELVLVLGEHTSTDWGTVILKTMFDCLVYYPLLIAAGFTVNLVVLDDKDWPYLKAKFREDFLSTWLASAVLWVPIDLLLFRYVPVHDQAFVVKSLDLVALVGFSYFVNKSPHSDLTFLRQHAADARPHSSHGRFRRQNTLRRELSHSGHDVGASFSSANSRHRPARVPIEEQQELAVQPGPGSDGGRGAPPHGPK
eukprot:EG_transcript_17837